MVKNKEKKHQTSRQKLVSQLIIYLIFSLGMLTMLYPFYISALNNYLDNIRVTIYKKEAKGKVAREKKLRAENERVQQRGLIPETDPFKEASTTMVSETYYKRHLLGSVSIPKLNITIPLFDLTTNNLLESGATVLNGTSYPLGGRGTHAVISAHRGLPNRTLFTDLPKLKLGDQFVLDVLGKKLAYQVEKIQVVKPDQTSVLQIAVDQDLVTLLTCTPYMINSHRLLVTGSRVPYTANIKKSLKQSSQTQFVINVLLLVGFILLSFLMMWVLYRIIHDYLLSRQRIAIKFRILDAENKPATRILILYDKKGKKALMRDGKVVHLTPDKSGTYQITDLAKRLYCLRTADGCLSIIIGQNKIRISMIKIKVLKGVKTLKKIEIDGS